MASKRRSNRARPATKYVMESSDDEEADVNTKKAKMKLKQMMRDDSDAESDFETEMKKNQPDEESSESDIAEKTKDKVYFNGSFAKSNCNDLNLSESDSSDDEKSKVVEKLKYFKDNKTDKTGHSFDNIDDDSEGDEGASQKLLALAGNLELVKNAWNEKLPLDTDDVHDTKITNTSKKYKQKKRAQLMSECLSNDSLNSSSITSLLAQGEGIVKQDNEDDDEEEEPEPITSKESVQVTVALPAHVRKKKKKGFDVAAFIKREIGKSRRHLQSLLHKAHFVCLLGHLRYLDLLLNCPLLQATALSVVPVVHSHTAKDLTMSRLGNLLSWLREAVPVNKHDFTKPPLRTRDKLLRALETFLAMDLTELVLVFVVICRSLGYKTRLVFNFPLIPLKPPDVSSGIVSETIKGPDKSTVSPKRSKEHDENDKRRTLSSKLSQKNKVCHEKNQEKSKSRKDKTDSTKGNKSKKGKTPIKFSGSDDEGDEVESKPKERKSMSSKLAAAVQKRSSTQYSRPSTSAKAIDREEEMLKKLNEKYPTEEKLTTESTEAENKYFPKSKSKGKSGSKVKDPKDYWAEVYLPRDNKWVPVDLFTGKMNTSSEFEGRCSKPLLHVLAVKGDGSVRDLTQRYSSRYMTEGRKLRTESAWIEECMAPYRGGDRDGEDKEKAELTKKAEEAPLPTSVSQFHNHPLYVLPRHLLKFEAIYPPTAPTLGFFKKEPVYARECVKTLNGRTQWLKEGRLVKLGEEPYKVVKARPKWDRMTGSKVEDQPLELFGEWQTEIYVPPPAVNGKVPRNEYGNVELFKPWMLPKGTVHIPINGMKSAIRKSGIDAAPAMVGWDFSGGGSHPVYDGVVVCQENAEALMDAWNQEQEYQAKRAEEKKQKRVLDNWKRLIKGLLIKEKIQAKYMES